MLGAFASGIFPRITEWHDDSPIAARGVRQHPGPRSTGPFYATVPVMLLHRRVPRVAARSGTTSGARPTTGARRKKNRHKRRSRTSARASGCRRCCATPPPGSCTLHLLRLHRPVHRHGDPRDRPPAARVAEVPARPHVPGVLAPAPTSPASCSSSGSSWAIGRRYIQRPYRIRIKTKPEDAVILGTFFVIGLTGFLTEARPHRARGPARRSRSGRSSAIRSRTSSTLVGEHAARRAPLDVGRARRRVPRVPRDPARPRSCGT